MFRNNLTKLMLAVAVLFVLLMVAWGTIEGINGISRALIGYELIHHTPHFSHFSGIDR